MKKLFVISIVLLGLFMVMPTISYADEPNNTILLSDLEGLNASARRQLIAQRIKNLKQAKKSAAGIIESVSDIGPSDLETWANVISTTIKTVCKDLSIGVNEFIKTDVGKITMFLVAYKVLGDDVKSIVFGLLSLMISMPIIISSFVHFHTSRKVKVRNDAGKITEVRYIRRYDFKSNEATTGSAAVHVLMFLVCFLLGILIIVV